MNIDSSKYWKLPRLGAFGDERRLRIDENENWRTFFEKRFPELSNTSYREINDNLLNLWEVCSDAQGCLQCYISNRIREYCIQIANKFGERYDFCSDDILPCVIGDKNFWLEILQTLILERSNLDNWIKIKLRSHKYLRDFLSNCGLTFIKDETLLVKTDPEELQEIIINFYCLLPKELQFYQALLEVFHLIYRHDLLQTGGNLQRGYPEPTEEQLERIRQNLQDRGFSVRSTQDVMAKLDQLSNYIRDYRNRRTQNPPNQLNLVLINPETNEEEIRDVSYFTKNPEEEEVLNFLNQQKQDSLDVAINWAISARLNYLREHPKRNCTYGYEHYIPALRLFYKGGLNMTEIAIKVGLQRKKQVTDLLKLKNWRENIKHRMLRSLRLQALEWSNNNGYVQLLELEPKDLLKLLDECIFEIFKKAEEETKTLRRDSVFAQRIRHCLDSFVN